MSMEYDVYLKMYIFEKKDNFLDFKILNRFFIYSMNYKTYMGVRQSVLVNFRKKRLEIKVLNLLYQVIFKPLF